MDQHGVKVMRSAPEVSTGVPTVVEVMHIPDTLRRSTSFPPPSLERKQTEKQGKKGGEAHKKKAHPEGFSNFEIPKL